jgi:uncharacterized protein YbcI
MREISDRLQASVNALLFARLLRDQSRLMRALQVSIEGSTVALILRRVASAFEDKLMRTPQGKAAIVAWEEDILAELSPMIREAVEACTGSRVTRIFRDVPEGHGRSGIVLMFRLESEPGPTPRRSRGVIRTLRGGSHRHDRTH